MADENTTNQNEHTNDPAGITIRYPANITEDFAETIFQLINDAEDAEGKNITPFPPITDIDRLELLLVIQHIDDDELTAEVDGLLKVFVSKINLLNLERLEIYAEQHQSLSEVFKFKAEKLKTRIGGQENVEQ